MDVCTACTAPNQAALLAEAADAPRAAAAAVGLPAAVLPPLLLGSLTAAVEAVTCVGWLQRGGTTARMGHVNVLKTAYMSCRQAEAVTTLQQVRHCTPNTCWACARLPPARVLTTPTESSPYVLILRTSSHPRTWFCCPASWLPSSLRQSLLLTLSFARLLALPPGLSSRRWSNAVPYTQPSASVAGLRTMHQPWSPSLRGWLLLGQATGSKQASDQAGTVPGMKGTTKASRLRDTQRYMRRGWATIAYTFDSVLTQQRIRLWAVGSLQPAAHQVTPIQIWFSMTSGTSCMPAATCLGGHGLC